MKQSMAEETFTTDSETPRNVELPETGALLPEFMRDPQRIHAIVSANEELICQQALTIKHLTLENQTLENQLQTANNKYETLLSLTKSDDLKNTTDSSGCDIRSWTEDMVSRVMMLEQQLSLAKVQLALKQDQLLECSLRNSQQRPKHPPQRSPSIISRENLQELFEDQPIERRRSTRSRKDNTASKELLEQWNKVLEGYGTSAGQMDRFREKVQPLLKKFIPHELRDQVWGKLVPNRQGITNSLYVGLLERRTKNWVCPKVRQQIDRDIKRSFSGKTQYKTTTGLILEVCQFLELFHLYRPDISYIQGMTYPALILIPIVGKIRAFHLFCNLVLGNPFFQQVFSFDNDYLATACRAFESLLEEQQPGLQGRLKEQDISAEIYLIEWLFTLFSRGLSYQAVLCFWDHLLFFEEVALFRVGLCVFEQLGALLKDSNYEQSIQMIRNFGHHVDEDKLLASLGNGKVSREKVGRALEKALKL